MKKMNNKGFSLVELIIVIAIMAILIVVLAPQYLKYVEKSRNSTDLQNATEIVTALQVYAGDPDSTVPAADGSITIGQTDQTIADTTFAGAALKEAGLLDGTTLHTRRQSRSNWGDYTITWKVDTSGGITFEYSAADGTAGHAANNFKERMMGANGAASSGAGAGG